MLLHKGADPNVTDSRGQMPIFVVAGGVDYPSTIATGPDGCRPTFAAAGFKEDASAVAKWLIEAGDSVRVNDDDLGRRVPRCTWLLLRRWPLYSWHTARIPQQRKKMGKLLFMV